MIDHRIEIEVVVRIACKVSQLESTKCFDCHCTQSTRAYRRHAYWQWKELALRCVVAIARDLNYHCHCLSRCFEAKSSSTLQEVKCLMRNVRFNLYVASIACIVYLVARGYRRCCHEEFRDFRHLIACNESIESIDAWRGAFASYCSSLSTTNRSYQSTTSSTLFIRLHDNHATILRRAKAKKFVAFHAIEMCACKQWSIKSSILRANCEWVQRQSIQDWSIVERDCENLHAWHAILKIYWHWIWVEARRSRYLLCAIKSFWQSACRPAACSLLSRRAHPRRTTRNDCCLERERVEPVHRGHVVLERRPPLSLCS